MLAILHAAKHRRRHRIRLGTKESNTTSTHLQVMEKQVRSTQSRQTEYKTAFPNFQSMQAKAVTDSPIDHFF